MPSKQPPPKLQRKSPMKATSSWWYLPCFIFLQTVHCDVTLNYSLMIYLLIICLLDYKLLQGQFYNQFYLQCLGKYRGTISRCVAGTKKVLDKYMNKLQPRSCLFDTKKSVSANSGLWRAPSSRFCLGAENKSQPLLKATIWK